MGCRWSRCMLFVALSVAMVSAGDAAEVVNLRVGQSGDKGFATYDLAGRIGEREAEVIVSLTINGEKFPAERLTLSGDFGKKVRTGVGKRIIWDILADISTGFEGEVIWNVDTPSSAASPPVAAPAKPPTPAAVAAKPATVTPAPGEHPFEFGEKTVRDKNTGFIWLKEVSTDGRGMNFSTARSAANRLSQEGFGDCNNWQLPQEGDLQKLIAYAIAAGYKGKRSQGYPADYFNALGFSGVSNDYYWVPYNPRLAPGLYNVGSAVDLEDGLAAGKPNTDYLQFWPVCKPRRNNVVEGKAANQPEAAVASFRPGPKESPFEFNELVARDKNTGLLWLREVSTDGNGKDFNRARGIADSLAQQRFAGCRNWQLPQPEDIQKTLVYAVAANYTGKKSNGYPADYFNSVGFSGVANDYYWTDLVDNKLGGYMHFRIAIDLEDGLSTSKPINDYLQYWPVCKP